MVNLLELDMVFEVAKVYLERILLHYLIPLMQANVKDKELWEEDQIQLVYSEKTPSDDHNMVKNACKAAMSAISDMEVDGQFLIFSLMNFVACSLDQRKNATTGRDLNLRQREAMLRSVQGLADNIIQHERIVGRLDAFFAKCVIEELGNNDRDQGFLRMRALFVYAELGSACNFGNNDINLKIALGVCSGLEAARDKAVQIAAAQALTVLLGNTEVKRQLFEHRNTMIGHLLNLMKEVELDDLVDALEGIVSHFSQTIAVDTVTGIIEELKTIYFQYKPTLNHQENSDENADEIIRAADSCLDTINNLMRSCTQHFPFDKLCPIIFELINDTLVRANDEICFEKCINLLNLLIYKTAELRDH